MIEKSHVDHVGQPIKKGEALLEIYSPELVQTEQELLSAKAYVARLAASNAGEGALSRAKALLYNVLVSLTTVVGALLAYYSLAGMSQILPYILAVAAASFIYVAVADLIPGLHKRTQIRATIQQVVLIVAGVLVIFFAHSTLH